MIKNAKAWKIKTGNVTIGNPESPVAIITLTSDLHFPKDKICAYGKMRTENLGVENVVANVITNPNIKYIIVCGKDSKANMSGQTILSLYKNGFDKEKKVIGSKGATPFVQHLTKNMLKKFQKQITPIDMIGVTNKKKIMEKVEEILKKSGAEQKEVWTRASHKDKKNYFGSQKASKKTTLISRRHQYTQTTYQKHGTKA